MSIKKELGRKIKNLRVARGYTQEKLAEKIDISQRALSSIESGDNFVSAETLDKLLRVFDITSEELFATNSLKASNDLLIRINANLEKIKDDSQRLEIIFNLSQSLVRMSMTNF